jgi:hypothetical protein
MMSKADFRSYHERVAARLRAVAALATAAAKARLIQKAEKHKQLAHNLPVITPHRGDYATLEISAPACPNLSWAGGSLV